MKKRLNNRISKKHKLMIIVLVIGIVAALFIEIKELYIRNNSNESELLRNEWGQGDERISMIATIDGESEKIDIELKERKYSLDELNQMSLEVDDYIQNVILRKEDRIIISEDINLTNSVDKYPFTIRWEISDDTVLNSVGHILCSEDCEENHKILVKAVLVYEEYYREIDYEIFVVHGVLNDRRRLVVKLENEIKRLIENTKEDKRIFLPLTVEGSSVIWKKPAKKDGVVALFVGFIMSAIIGIAYDYDTNKKMLKEREELQFAYPEFVERLKLYMISGKSVKNSFIMCYESLSMNEESIYRRVVEELRKSCNAFKNGEREEKVYEDFGDACGGNYKKLCFLLNINLRRGDANVVKVLDEEVSRAFELKKEQAVKRTEEAGTKMLFPMMLMLIVVMLLIILPVYFSF